MRHRTVRTATGVLVGFAFAATVVATPATADGLHIFNEQAVWGKGCNVTYSLGASLPTKYRTAIADGLAALRKPLAMTFTQVPDGGMLRYSISTKLPQGVSGLGSTTGTVQLVPLRRLPDWRDAKINADLRQNLIVHETLHSFGLAHDLDEGHKRSDEIMFPILSVKPLHFGRGDLAGMAFIKSKNGCGMPNGTAPAGETTPTGTPGVPWNPATYNPDNNYPGTPGFIRPPDGSGYKYSNASGVTVTAGCPVTVSKVTFGTFQATPTQTWAGVRLNIENASPAKAAFTLTAIIALPDGTIVQGLREPDGVFLTMTSEIASESSGEPTIPAPDLRVADGHVISINVACQ